MEFVNAKHSPVFMFFIFSSSNLWEKISWMPKGFRLELGSEYDEFGPQISLREKLASPDAGSHSRIHGWARLMQSGAELAILKAETDDWGKIHFI